MVLLLTKDRIMCKKCGKVILLDVMRIYSEVYDETMSSAVENDTEELFRYNIKALGFISGCRLDTENLWCDNNGCYTDAFKQQIDYLEMDLGGTFYDDHLPTMRKNFTKMLEKYTVVDSLLNTVLAACAIENSK